ncbi:MAG: nitronate monooxygenase [Actinomycetota bacterium]
MNVTRRPSGPRTRLCDLLGVRHPVVQAPMAGGWTTPALVAAVCNAGGLGMLAASRVPPERLREDIRAVKGKTDEPFGVNFLLAGPEGDARGAAEVQRFLDRFRGELGLPPAETPPIPPPSPLEEQLAVVFEEGVPLLSVALGDPGDLAGRAHERGMLFSAMATTVEEAVLAARRGADFVVAQGAEAGGHRSTFEVGPGGEVPLVGTMALVPQVVDAVEVPVVAAGGIADGRGLAAALALGAEGVQIGTRFLTASESGAFPAYRERLLSARETDTIITRVFSGRPARGIRNRLVRAWEWDGPEPLPYPLQSLAAGDVYAAARSRDDGDYAMMLAGQATRLLRPGQSAAEIVEEVVAGARATIRRLESLSV